MQTPGMLVMSNMAPGAIDRLVSYAQAAEARGLRNFLVTESATDSLALAQHIAGKTSRIQVGTGITNLYLRHPLLAALHVMTIDQVAPGRMLLGLGTSHVPTNKAYGIAMDKPLTALREYLTTVSRVFRGEYEGLAQMAARGLAVPKAERKIPVYVAGISPKSIVTTGELADGSLPLNYAPHGLKEVVDGIAQGAHKAGRAPEEVAVALIMHCCVCPDKAVALRSVKRTLAFYGRMPFYNRLFVRQGYRKEAEGISAGWAQGDVNAAADAVSEQMAGQIAALGTAQECQKKVEEFEKAGASYVVLYPTAIDGDYEKGVRAVLDAFGR
ncbi:MAG TPA: LLM class flavin-dependent oxidoreductase [Candidatus Binatia bacterium]|nr:LLM class flavin-dependent oxidoreductase [Candidatus Binatia bacterium]